MWCNNQDFSCLLKDCGHWIKPNQTKLTWVFPPVLSCTALLERAVLAAKDLKEAPKMLLTPKAISSCSQVRQIVARYHNLGEWCTSDTYADDYLVSIDGVVVFYRIDFCHGECNSKPHYSHGEGIHCSSLEDFHVWSDRWLISGSGNWVAMVSLHVGITPNSNVAVKTASTETKTLSRESIQIGQDPSI